ncbi:MAG: hypothetical protein ABI534_09415 [Chloroflexota bacterium]
MNRRHAASIAVALGLVLLLAACAGAGGGGSASPGTDDGAVEHPTAADALVLRMEHAGGFVMPEFLFGAVPAFSLYGDGTVIVPGAVPEIFPGPALPPLQARRLNEAGIQAILAKVAQTGIFVADARFDGAQMMIADAADTVFTLNADDRSVEVSIYGLGALDPQSVSPEMPEREVAAHAVLGDLSNALFGLDTQLDAGAWLDEAWHPYQPTALRLLVRPADTDPLDGTENFAPWPIEGEDPASFGQPGTMAETRCGALTGEAAAAWIAALSAGNQSTRFTTDGHRYAVTARSLLPDEEAACPGA